MIRWSQNATPSRECRPTFGGAWLLGGMYGDRMVRSARVSMAEFVAPPWWSGVRVSVGSSFPLHPDSGKPTLVDILMMFHFS